MSNSLLRVHEFTFGKNVFFLGRSLIFGNLLTLTKKLLVFLAKIFQQSYQKCILRVQVKFRGKSFRKFTVFHFFLFMGRKIWTFDENFSTVRRNCILRVHGNNSKKDMWVNRNIMFFGVSVKSFPRGSAEYHSTCSQTFFELLIKFSSKSCIYNCFGFWAENPRSVEKTRRGYRNCLLHIKRKLLVSKNFFWINVSFCNKFGSLS